MDIDREPVNGGASSPPPQSDKSSAQANFSVPIPNGANGTTNGDAPAPPPHGSNPSSPTPTAKDDAEAYKAAGNRLFKEKNYDKAIEQYTKGTNNEFDDTGQNFNRFQLSNFSPSRQLI